jgi:hypothetical protein
VEGIVSDVDVSGEGEGKLSMCEELCGYCTSAVCCRQTTRVRRTVILVQPQEKGAVWE